MKKRYITRITQDHWNAKNKLQEEAKRFAHKMDRLLMEEDALPCFKDVFKQGIMDLNAKYPRCKPLELNSWKIPDPVKYNTWDFYVTGLFHVEVVELQGLFEVL